MHIHLFKKKSSNCIPCDVCKERIDCIYNIRHAYLYSQLNNVRIIAFSADCRKIFYSAIFVLVFQKQLIRTPYLLFIRYYVLIG